MIGVTPIGIITSQPAESRRFYREVMGFERVLMVKEVQGEGIEGMLLRLESPYVEVFSTETRLLDRVHNRTVRREYSLQYHPDNLEVVLYNLENEHVAIDRDKKGVVRFEDFNGISWEIKPEKLFFPQEIN